MSTLAQQHCEPCQEGAQALTNVEQNELLPQLSQWHIIDEQGVSQLLKTYPFNNFVDALAFANQVGELAESYDHHPALLVEWGQVSVRWWTHKIAGLHHSDFIMAAKTDLLPLAS